MDTEQTSLRSLVDKWLAPTPAKPARLTRFGRTTKGVRFVCLEIRRLTDPLTIAFFYHDDGGWRVFPPERSVLEMAVTGLQKPVRGNSRSRQPSMSCAREGQ
ncbi:MAG TPA: hypothetical protein VF534_13070 [Paraburkholderia sp.]